MDDFQAMTTREVAERLGVTRSAVTAMARQGALRPLTKLDNPGFGFYLFDPADVERYAKLRDSLGREKPGPKPKTES